MNKKIARGAAALLAFVLMVSLAPAEAGAAEQLTKMKLKDKRHYNHKWR